LKNAKGNFNILFIQSMLLSSGSGEKIAHLTQNSYNMTKLHGIENST